MQIVGSSFGVNSMTSTDPVLPYYVRVGPMYTVPNKVYIALYYNDISYEQAKPAKTRRLNCGSERKLHQRHFHSSSRLPQLQLALSCVPGVRPWEESKPFFAYFPLIIP